MHGAVKLYNRCIPLILIPSHKSSYSLWWVDPSWLRTHPMPCLASRPHIRRSVIHYSLYLLHHFKYHVISSYRRAPKPSHSACPSQPPVALRCATGDVAHIPPRLRLCELASYTRSSRPRLSSSRMIWCTMERTFCFSKSTTRSGFTGVSYGSSTPVKPLIWPARAAA